MSVLHFFSMRSRPLSSVARVLVAWSRGMACARTGHGVVFHQRVAGSLPYTRVTNVVANFGHLAVASFSFSSLRCPLVLVSQRLLRLSNPIHGNFAAS